MARKNSGRDFLFSDDCGFINGDEDGGESYKYSDGSGYYHGADGSEGYIYSDGSGYFHGADSSDGYIYSDGSAYYHGADGSDGYKYSDGSGYFTDSVGGRTSYDANDDDDNTSDGSFTESLGTILGAGLAGVMAASANAVAAERERETQREAEKREKRREWCHRHRKGIFITVLIFAIAIFGMVGYYEFQKMIPVGYSNEALEGLKYTEVVQKLKESGFSSVYTKEVSDLTISREDEENLVTEINLILLGDFEEDTKYPSNMRIEVVYHTVELYAPPLTSKEAKGMDYLEVIEAFEDAGFTNVTTDIEYDIITGWLTDDGEVKSVTINGEKKFDSYDEYRLDAEVVVTYHTLKSNKPK